MQLDWDNLKSVKLKQERDISFEDIAVALEQGGLVDFIDHPNQAKYPHQKMMVVAWAGYMYLVPCVKTQTGYFLKTIIPSRKANKEYQAEGE